MAKHSDVDTVVNFASSRSVFQSTMELLEYPQIKSIAIIAEGVPERRAREILHVAQKKGVTIIAVTENLESPMATGADIVLPMAVTRETDRYNSQGTTSFTVLSVIFDALQTALIEVTGYQNESFALIHPGGAVGERLNKG